MSIPQSRTDKSVRRDQQRALRRENDLTRAQAHKAARRKSMAFIAAGILLAALALTAAVSYALRGAGSVATSLVLADLGAPASTMASPPTNGCVKVAAPIYRNGKPELLFIGAQYCPHCAGQRWSVVKALNQFGTFSNLQSSASSEGDIPTFDLLGSTYTSRFVSFDHKDVEDQNHNALQSLDRTEQSLFNRYDTTGSIPLVLVGGYAISGDAYNLADIQGRSFQSVQRAMQHGDAIPIVADINAEANALTAFLCNADSMKPSSVCSRPVIRSIVKTLH